MLTSNGANQIVARAIHAIADTNRPAELIWAEPTQAECDHVDMACQEYVRHGDFEPGVYRWGIEHLEVKAD